VVSYRIVHGSFKVISVTLSSLITVTRPASFTFGWYHRFVHGNVVSFMQISSFSPRHHVRSIRAIIIVHANVLSPAEIVLDIYYKLYHIVTFRMASYCYVHVVSSVTFAVVSCFTFKVALLSWQTFISSVVARTCDLFISIWFDILFISHH